jgi:hypothetical protein
MSLEYQKGRYDELVERHKELLDLYRGLQQQMHSTYLTSGGGVHGAEVHYYTGTRINTKTIGLTFSTAGISLTLANYFFGLSVLTLGLTISATGIVFSLLQFLKKDKDKE